MTWQPYDAFRLDVDFAPAEGDKDEDFTAYLEDLERRTSVLGSPRLTEKLDFWTVFWDAPVAPAYITSVQAASLLAHASSIRLGKDRQGRKTANLEFETVPELSVKMTQIPQKMWGKREVRSKLRRIVGTAR